MQSSNLLLLALLTALASTGCSTSNNAQQTAAVSPGAVSNSLELAAIFKADQDDRQGVIDWHNVSQRDEAREKRVREILASGGVQTPGDYYHAAMVFQHSSEGDGMHLAHELAMIGASLGDRKCRWLAAASYDRLLNRLGKEQRFGTQYVGTGGSAPTLSPILPGVTDSMRAALNVPTLEQAKAREEKIKLEWEKSNPSTAK